MHNKTAFDFSPSTAVAAAGIGGGLGLSARLLRHLVDTVNDRADSSGKAAIPQTQPVAKVPVEVSDEEAAQLERQGVRVRKVGSFLADAGLGALGAGTAALAWKGSNKLLSALRQSSARERLERERKRVQMLLEGNPQPEDANAAEAMKVAYELHKRAFLTDILDAFPQGTGTVLGVGGVLAGMAAYNRAGHDNRYDDQLKEIRRSIHEGEASAPQLVLEPVARKKNTDGPRIEGGSPAEQAEDPKEEGIPAKLASWFGRDLSKSEMAELDRMAKKHPRKDDYRQGGKAIKEMDTVVKAKEKGRESKLAAWLKSAADIPGTTERPDLPGNANSYAPPVGGKAQPIQALPQAQVATPDQLTSKTAAQEGNPFYVPPAPPERGAFGQVQPAKPKPATAAPPKPVKKVIRPRTNESPLMEDDGMPRRGK